MSVERITQLRTLAIESSHPYFVVLLFEGGRLEAKTVATFDEVVVLRAAQRAGAIVSVDVFVRVP